LALEFARWDYVPDVLIVFQKT